MQVYSTAQIGPTIQPGGWKKGSYSESKVILPAKPEGEMEVLIAVYSTIKFCFGIADTIR